MSIDLSTLTAFDWALLALGGLVIGFSKTAFSGLGTLVAVIFALVLPTRASTGAIVPLLIVGDVIAVSLYRRHADWKLLVRLLPYLIGGLLLGVVFLDSVDDVVLRRFLGVLLLVLAAMQLRSLLRPAAPTEEPGVVTAPSGPETWGPARRRVTAALAGGGAGFATMVANAAGPISSMYLLVMRVSKMAFVGTAAWLYAIVNVTKVPFSVQLGLIDPQSLLLDLLLVPALLVGAFVGVKVLRRVPQQLFTNLTLVLTALSAVALLLV
ncbi:sulfite exporter TauE/SafE family protein [Streptomyces sp. NP160]|uniref:sulfite exporter TauE/SafE family protein n=1 Tax=Streptomyces sp. NP160 TaxID=2586637 RepID=UPI001C5921C1|nr:sulfite exporter TauE/SafE family protein [Streptomyces sp. NP160]